jgi:hypothetical protein
MSTYVDDIRTTGRTAALCWSISHQVGTHLCYLGIQDALRKRTLPSQRPGIWTGTLAQTPPEAVLVSCTQEKWTRARAYVKEMRDIVAQGLPFAHKELERKRGFLIYVTRTYPSLVPFLKGIHFTLDSWQTGRDQDGWKALSQVSAHLQMEIPSSSQHPPQVYVPLLLNTLRKFMVSPGLSVTSTVSPYVLPFPSRTGNSFIFGNGRHLWFQ